MVILVNRRGGSETDPHAFLVQFNILTGNVEFSTKGANGTYTGTLIERPYLDRWYHVAVIRQSESFTGYVDGRQIFSSTGNVGDAKSSDGLSIGGWGSGKYLFGEVQEAAIYQTASSQEFIVSYIFQNQPTNDPSLNLKGYFKLGFSANATENLKNFAPSPVPSGTEIATKQGSGPVEFEEANQAGEQSAFDSRRNGGRDALSPLSGAFSWEQTAISRPTPGVAFDFRFGYSSANAFGGFKLGGTDPYASGPLGNGWRHTFETRVLPAQTFSPLADTDTLGLLLWNGAIESWDRDLNTGEYSTRDKEYKGELLLTTTNCQWTTPDRLVYAFKRPDSGPAVMRGRLLSIRDFNSNAVQVLWNETSGVITQVIDTARGVFNFAYKANLLTNLSFGPWSVNFAYDSTNRLISKSITNASGIHSHVNTTWRFDYYTSGPSSNLLQQIIDPRGNTNVLVHYDKYGRKTNAVDAIGRATQTEYGVTGKRQIRHTDPGTNRWVETYDRKHRLLVQQDPLTNKTAYTYDEFGNRRSITEPLGWTTFFGYDDRANVIARTNALGEVSRWTFDSFFNKAIQEINPLNWTNAYAYDAAGNLTSHSDALGSLVRYTYATNGLVLISTDANQYTSRFGYDTNGFLIARTDTDTNTWQFIVNEVGWKLAEINPFNDTTSFAYDLSGNTVQTTDPLNRTFTRQWDANGNLLAQSDGKGQFTRHAYDAANQRTNTTDRTGTNNWFTFYTARGKPDRATDPLGNTSTNYYDAANRLIAVSDPLGNTITNQYDANGNSIALSDSLGQRWSKTFDRLNRVIAQTDPLGNTRQTDYDPAGRIKTVITPNGFPSQHEYDGRGRLTKWKDAEGFDWLYAYDGNANIVDIEDALHGHYVMAYGPRNERTLERNQDNFEWRYTYDPLLRLKTQRDPNLTLRTRNYDQVSRVTSLTLSTGREDTYTYDDNDNPRVIARRVNSVAVAASSLTYDPLDRATRVVDPHTQSVDYGFDALSRVVSVTYPGNRTLTNRYDALSRLTNQVDWAARQMSYGYDKAGRLIRRAYPNGVVQTNTFDTAGRLTGLQYSVTSNQPVNNGISIALAYAYDRNGNKVASTEKGVLRWPPPSLTDETARYTKSGRLIDREVVPLAHPMGEGQGEGGISPSTLNYTYDSSGNMTNAVGGGQSWRLTYDEDNRTTSILWDAGITSKLITNRYDALGRRIARKLDGVETRYVLDLSGGMERVLCDTTSSGQVTAFYIHGPDLCYRVDANNNILCYHADAQANIISVTDGGATNVAQYAYTPYGRSLGSTNLQSQIANPYLFVGSQGVMEELPGLYFMRARYYSADAGVFLSTDPVKKIGPGWKPVSYTYGNANPLSFSDPNGEFAHILAGAGLGIISGGFSDVFSQGLENGFGNIDWNHVMMSSAIGGIKGTIAAATLGGSLFFKVGADGGESYLDNGYENWSAAGNFNAGAGQSILNGSIKGGLSYGLGKAVDAGVGKILPNYSGGQAQAQNLFNRAVSGDITKNTARKIEQVTVTKATEFLAEKAMGNFVDAAFNQITTSGQNASSRTATAGSYAQSVNSFQITSPASSFNMAGTTPMVSNSSSSGGGSFAKVANSISSGVSKATNSVTQAVKSVATTVSAAVKSVVSTVKGWFK